MTNIERIRAMSAEELANLLADMAYSGKGPWEEPFERLFCEACPAPEYTLDDGRKLALHECDFEGCECPHGRDIVWWLGQPVEETTPALKTLQTEGPMKQKNKEEKHE